MRGAMAALPLSSGPQAAEIAKRMRNELTHEFGIVVPVNSFAGKVWLRISAQIYNELDDYRRCSDAIIILRARHGI
jgi:isopenicillin-N epimerase